MFKDACIPDADRWRSRQSYYPDYAEPSKSMDVMTTDNPVVATLLDAKGKPIAQWRARPPVGFRRPE